MKSQLFATFILILLIFQLKAYYAFREHFSGKAELQVKAKNLEASLEKQKIKNEMLAFQIRDFKQYVASQVPEVIREDKSLGSRNVASFVEKPNEVEVDFSRGILEKGRTLFREQQFDKAIEEFQIIEERYSTSPAMIDALFLLTESFYQAKRYEDCVATAEKMLSLFPENELTGFSLIRLGQVLQEMDRVDDAAQVYRTVLEVHKNPNLRKQAQKLLREVEL